MKKPTLSVIIPMRDNVPQVWIEALAKVEGNVEFILVYPPEVPLLNNDDPRIRQITSPIRGEVIQRITAVSNASGTYVLSINCDEYLYPKIEEVVLEYFRIFPNSYMFKLRQKFYPYGSQEKLLEEWEPFTNLEAVQVRRGEDRHLETTETLQEVPISPLENKLNLLCLIKDRKDHHGPHQENFDKKVWKNSLVQECINDVVKLFTLFGPFKYIPFWCADRLLGLGVQAKLYTKGLVKKGDIIGHILPFPEQFRTESNPPEFQYKTTNRRYVLAEVFLVKLYPQYGYLWNLVLGSLRRLVRLKPRKETFLKLIPFSNQS
ncbi:glycosyltransferase family A protein [Crocosphaera sp.]|uniref:glycosyltransferase family A protein n=1 Tax=Crocosphaera sp. TaxID=2729996 RepID=UPI0026078C58|nr:glycosyltransferase family A protein [Crocosphaera sp.]MDJ0579429.1 glycosyltransferase family A protein [Crocosphaera sp.]